MSISIPTVDYFDGDSTGMEIKVQFLKWALKKVLTSVFL